MKLLNDLFEIIQSSVNGSDFVTSIKLFPGHVIYQGHFPGHPITPGVVQLQIVHELLESHFSKNIRLLRLDDCKFLKIVNPEERKPILISIGCVVNESHLRVKATGQSGADIFLKLKGLYQFL